MMLMQKERNSRYSKGNRFKNKSGWGGPRQCVPRKKMKEVYRHKCRWISIKTNPPAISDDAYERGSTVGSKGSRSMDIIASGGNAMKYQKRST